MAITQFKLPIGAKRQVTIPRDFMKLLSLEEGGELLLQIVDDHAVVIPMVSVPRTELPENLRKKFAARRGRKTSDIPLDNFLAKMPRSRAGKATPVAAIAAAKAKSFA
ncbi:MAG TPA: AbrB/MazE/SpoVT family DNA-binding domain-containing protein [Acidobacteriaceae bacterium]